MVYVIKAPKKNIYLIIYQHNTNDIGKYLQLVSPILKSVTLPIIVTNKDKKE